LIASLLPSAGTSAQEVFEQPVDPRDTLRELDDQVLAKQKALFAARLRGNPEEIRKAEEEFAEIQKKRKETVRTIERLR
jgi:hypothetical protein